jgi:hypothetical protein
VAGLQNRLSGRNRLQSKVVNEILTQTKELRKNGYGNHLSDLENE